MVRRAVPSARSQGTGAKKEGPGTPLLVLVFSRRHDAVPFWCAGPHRRFVMAVLPPGSRRSLRERAVHHDPGAVWMAYPVGALVVGESVGVHGVRPPFQRALSAVLPKAARADLGERHTAAVPDAGFRLQRISAALEHAVVFRDLGWYRDTSANPDHRPSRSAISPRR